MTNALKFLEAVRQGSPAGDESVAAYWAHQLDMWVTDLRELRSAIRGWLQPLIDGNAVKVTDVDFPISEPDLGNYMAPGLTIEVLGELPRQVDVRPRGARVVGVVETGGARVVGASGRVDLECALRREIVLRFRDGGVTNWCSFGGGTKVDVGEETFFDLLSRVTNIHPEA